MADFNPFEAGLAEPESANAAPAFDPFANGQAEPEFDPFKSGMAEAEQSTVKNVVNAAGRGALDQGFYSGIEGLARGADRADRENDALRIKDGAQRGGYYAGLAATLGDLERAEAQSPNATRREQIAKVRTRMGELDMAAAPAVAALDARPLDASLPGWYAGAVADARAGIRTALPVDAEFEKSLGGQIISGLGQAAGTLPLYAVGGAGPAVTIGQMYDQGYQDAKQSGADEATASKAGFANVPAAALDVAADKLIVGKILKPLKGRVSVGQILKSVVASAVSEGATEGAQQVWQNLVAKQLVGYDPARPLDDQVINSIIVGAVVGGGVSAIGQAVTAAGGKRGREGGDQRGGTETTTPPAEPVVSEQAAAFNPFASGEAVADEAPAPDQSKAGMVEQQAGTPAPAQATPAPTLPADDFADITPESILNQPLPAAENAAGSGASPADSVPVADATRPAGAQTTAVTERSGESTTGKTAAEGNRFRLGGRPDGVVDLLDAIDAIGGIAPPGERAGGEYDGFRETFGKGAPRLLVRKAGQRIDQAMRELESHGHTFDSPSAFLAAVDKAAKSRRDAVEAMRSEQDQGKFADAIFGNKGKRANERGKAPVNTDTFNVGDRFKVKGEPFEVVSVDPDTFEVTVRDGPRYGTQVLPGDTSVFPDAKSIKRADAGKKIVPAGDEPFARRKQAPVNDGQFDAFAGGETGGDTLFNLQGPSIDSTIANWSIDEEMAKREAGKAQQRAQGELLFSRRDEQVQTPAFKQWFGGSLVKDSAGNPLVVYRGEHGEGGGDFHSRLPSLSFGSAEAASTYAEIPNNRGDTAQAPRVTPAYLRIEKPVINNPDEPFVDFGEISKAIGKKEAVKLAVRFNDRITETSNWEENFASDYSNVADLLVDRPSALRELYMDAFPLLDDPEFVRLAKAKGFDGAIHGGNGETAMETEYRVFDPSQAKSSIGNNGAFSREDPRILFAQRTADPELAAADRARLTELQSKWRANAEKIAPGLMQKFRLSFGDPSILVRMGRAEARNLTGTEEAAYLGHERMLFLFDQALLRKSDLNALLNLTHEMGHAHWDTLPLQRQMELMDQWRSEIMTGTGPLYTQDKTLKRGVALGVESSVKEWYAERIAWANHRWAAARMGGEGLVGRMAQNFRQLLVKFSEYVASLRGVPVESINRDFRTFLNQGDERWSDVPAPRVKLEGKPRVTTAPGMQPIAALAQRGGNADFARRTPAQVVEDSARNAKTWLVRNMTSAGGLPAKVFEAKLAKDGRMASIGKQVEFALRDLDRAMHVVYGGYKAMTPAQLAQLNDVLGGALPVSAVDPRLQGPLFTMRTHIDTLSARLVREGAVDAKLQARVAGNLGFYLNRSYRKFDDVNWSRNVPDAVRNRAETFIAAQLAAQNPGHVVDPREVKGYVEYLLNKDTANESIYREPAKLGAKSLDVMIARKDIPEELRDLMGEYKDPRVNYLRSVAKTAQILEANTFLRETRRIGMGRWLFPRPIVDVSGSYTVPLAPKGSESMSPLNGLYATKEIAAAFQSQLEAAPGMALRTWMAVNGWAKVSKTVLSPVTQARNLFGNLGFVVANGHWRADATADVWKAMRADFGVGDTPASRDYLARLARLGVVGESVNAGELREALNDAGANLQGFEHWTDSRLMRVLKSPFNAAARIYQLNDEVFKIYSFENERRAWAKVNPALTGAQLDAIASERVRNTLPTYSLIPKAVQSWRRLGLTGSFLSFPSEIVRTTYHSIRYALSDLAAANPRQQAMGAKRLAGLITVAALPAAASMATRWLANVDKDDEEDVRRFLPSWSENSALYFTNADGKGRFGLIDASYLDPWNYLKKPLTAALRGEDWQASLLSAAREALDPFAGEGLVTKAVFDLARNQDDRGRQIYSPQAPFLDRASDQLAHVWSVYEPGAVTQARRVVKAAKGEVSAGGRTYDLENELSAVITGARRQDIDLAQSLLFRAKRFAGERQGAELLFKSVRDRKGTVDAGELEAAREKMETARRALYAQLSEDTAAAKRQGVSQSIVLQALLGAGIGETDAALILTGRYVPFYGQASSSRRAMQGNVEQRP